MTPLENYEHRIGLVAEDHATVADDDVQQLVALGRDAVRAYGSPLTVPTTTYMQAQHVLRQVAERVGRPYASIVEGAIAVAAAEQGRLQARGVSQGSCREEIGAADHFLLFVTRAAMAIERAGQ